MKPMVEVVTLSHPVSWGVTAVMYIVYWNIKKKKLVEKGDQQNEKRDFNLDRQQ